MEILLFETFNSPIEHTLFDLGGIIYFNLLYINNSIIDDKYVHTDNNYTDYDKNLVNNIPKIFEDINLLKDTKVDSLLIKTIVSLTLNEYDSLIEKDNSTLYIIIE